MRPILAFCVLVIFGVTSAEAQRRCTKGIPCGGTCISADKVCRVGTTPAPTTPPRPAAAAPAEATVVTVPATQPVTPQPTEDPLGTRWEYHVLRMTNGSPWQASLAALGDQRWELVASVPELGYVNLVFKRPKP